MSYKICKHHENFGLSGGLVILSGLSKANMNEPKERKIPSEFKHVELDGPIAPILPRPYFSAHVLVRLKSQLTYRNASPRTPINTSRTCSTSTYGGQNIAMKHSRQELAPVQGLSVSLRNSGPTRSPP